MLTDGRWPSTSFLCCAVGDPTSELSAPTVACALSRSEKGGCVRDDRLAALHAFERRWGWSVLGLYQDLSRDYPVEPLLGAVSAQAELALTGDWDGWAAVVASVLVRSGGPTPDRRHHDLVVQLTTLDIGPLPWQFTATQHDFDRELVVLTPSERHSAEDVTRVLRSVDGSGLLKVGDHLAANGVQLLHTRVLHDHGKHIDVAGPLDMLAVIARASQT